MRRTCSSGAVTCVSWRWRAGVLTRSGFHRFDGGACQADRAGECPDEVAVPAELEALAVERYEADLLPGDKPWALLGEDQRAAWRSCVGKGLLA